MGHNGEVPHGKSLLNTSCVEALWSGHNSAVTRWPFPPPTMEVNLVGHCPFCPACLSTSSGLMFDLIKWLIDHTFTLWLPKIAYNINLSSAWLKYIPSPQHTVFKISRWGDYSHVGLKTKSQKPKTFSKIPFYWDGSSDTSLTQLGRCRNILVSLNLPCYVTLNYFCIRTLWILEPSWNKSKEQEKNLRILELPVLGWKILGGLGSKPGDYEIWEMDAQ